MSIIKLACAYLHSTWTFDYDSTRDKINESNIGGALNAEVGQVTDTAF